MLLENERDSFIAFIYPEQYRSVFDYFPEFESYRNPGSYYYKDSTVDGRLRSVIDFLGTIM